jgi:hypothetical protein
MCIKLVIKTNPYFMFHGLLLHHEFFEVLATFNFSFMSNNNTQGNYMYRKKNVSSSLLLKIMRQVSSKRR